MDDYILKATGDNGSIRVYIGRTTDTVAKAEEYHKTYSSGTAALGRLLTATSLMGSMMKNEKDLITLKIEGDGPLKGILATANNKGNVKGYVYNKEGDIPFKEDGKINVGEAIGKGYLSIVQDIGLKEPYVGQVELVSGEVAEDIAYYYAKSEQINTGVVLGVLVNKDLSVKEAGGFIVQLLPNTPEETIVKLENNLNNLLPITKLLENGETPESILELILNGFIIKIHEKIKVSYKCDCSKYKIEKALITLGKKELNKILVEDKEIKVNCHFCNKNYTFSEEEISQLISEISN